MPPEFRPFAEMCDCSADRHEKRSHSERGTLGGQLAMT